MKSSVIAVVAAALSCAISSFSHAADTYPTRPIRLLVGYAVGGTADIVARILAQEMSKSMGQSVIVENKAGANALIATNAVLRSPPDGYTITMASLSHVVNPILVADQATYDPVESFAPISQVAVLPLVMVTANDSKFTSLQELITTAQGKPDHVSYSSAGIGGSGHLAGAMLEQDAHAQMMHVPFKGNAPGLMEVEAGRVSFMFYPTIGITQLVGEQRIKVLGVASKERMPQFPNIPTLEELGYSGFENTAIWLGLLARAGTPKEIVERLHQETLKALSNPAVQAKLDGLGVQRVGTSPTEFSTFLVQDHERWARVIKAAGLR